MKIKSNDLHEIDKKQHHITPHKTSHTVDMDRIRAIMQQDGHQYSDDQLMQIYRFLELLADLSNSCA